MTTDEDVTQLKATVIELRGEIDEISQTLVMLLLEAKRHGWILSVKGWDTSWKT
jgi:hypothetical protein